MQHPPPRRYRADAEVCAADINSDGQLLHVVTFFECAII